MNRTARLSSRFSLLLFTLFTPACMEFRGGPVIAGNHGSAEAGGRVGGRFYDNGPGHYYDSVRPVVGIAGDAAWGSRSMQRYTLGPEVGLDNYWTDAEHGAWSFRGLFARGELGHVTDSANGSDRTINYFGGGATLLFRLADSETLTWGLDGTAGSSTDRDGNAGVTWSGSLLIEWP